MKGKAPGAAMSRSRCWRESGSDWPPAAGGPYAGSRTMPEMVTALGSTLGAEGVERDGAVVMVKV